MNANNLISVGRLSGRVNALPDAIRAAATRAGIEPVMIIDGVPMFNVIDVHSIATALQNGQAITPPRAIQ